MDADGQVDLVLPGCDEPTCTVPVIYMHSKNTWLKLLAASDAEHATWRFPDGDFRSTDLLNFPPVLRLGDFTMDGYPDAVAVFEGKGSKRMAFLLENVPCSNGDTSCFGSRALAFKTKIDDDAAMISFFDVYENGILDFLVVVKKEDQEGYAVKAYRNDFNTDTTFLKITVLSGRCYKTCICKKIETPYGANLVGAAVSYKTVSPEGKIQICSATQLSQSAHFALQLPYTLFGLGRSPNFVDKVQVGIPQSDGKVNRVHSWMSLIPNSQVIVIPFPPDKPYEWMTKLLVTPSKLLLQTGGVLIGTCVFVAGLILMLYIKEKREDEKEKRQEAHKFHFDAL
ncbi:T-cell immunomodulatory protein-like [Rhopilema esculentum]|uniref:T-cell immunomodulatory protein-like n=1 Tax=Rhopilema esculentum TaxID=499914 RepID=UPI0031E40FE9